MKISPLQFGKYITAINNETNERKNNQKQRVSSTINNNNNNNEKQWLSRLANIMKFVTACFLVFNVH